MWQPVQQDELCAVRRGERLMIVPDKNYRAALSLVHYAAVECEIKLAHVIGKRGRRCDLRHGAMK